MHNYFSVFTVCNVAYLHKALALAESVFSVSGIITKIYIIDGKRTLVKESDFFEIIWVEDIKIPNWEHLAYKYDITEFSTSVKPYIALDLLSRYSKVIFLDPDIYVYSSLDKIFEELNTNDLILTPHYVVPHPYGDLGMLRFGSFNLGFFAVNKSSNALNFLNWWWDRCKSFCFFETQFGLSTDQKWVSIAPCFFPWIRISHDLSLNVAFWNLHERKISIFNNVIYVNENLPLTFFHFSSFDDKNPIKLSKRPIPFPENLNSALETIAINYKERSNSYKNYCISDEYTFDYMSDGSYISPTLRRAYSAKYEQLKNIENPFIYSGLIKHFLIKNNLHTFSAPYNPLGIENKDDSKLFFKLINFSMRLLLRIIGPNKFMNFSRLLVYLSSYRINTDLWKS